MLGKALFLIILQGSLCIAFLSYASLKVITSQAYFQINLISLADTKLHLLRLQLLQLLIALKKFDLAKPFQVNTS